MQELGIQTIAAYSPEARGRLERNFGTWQNRLPQELRVAGITSLEGANQFLRERYIVEFNGNFPVTAQERGTAFRPYSRKDLDFIFSVRTERVVDKDKGPKRQADAVCGERGEGHGYFGGDGRNGGSDHQDHRRCAIEMREPKHIQVDQVGLHRNGRIVMMDCMRTVFEAAGGIEGLRRLAEAWHRRVMADEVVAHAFSHGFHPQHVERLAAYWAEALGGPPAYSDSYGDETFVVKMHSGNGEHDEMDRRAIACFDRALVDTGLANGDALQQVLHDYFAWATTTTMSRYHQSADDVPKGLRIPRWSWGGFQG